MERQKKANAEHADGFARGGRQLCPECASVMLEAERLTEHGAIYVWYRCSRGDCDGNWLKRVQPKIA